MISQFQEELNDKNVKVVYFTNVAGANCCVNTANGTPIPKISRKRKVRIKRGVRLSTKYMAACR